MSKPEDVSRNPERAKDVEIIVSLKSMGKKIKTFRRRFVALLPEIEKRQLYKKLNYDSTANLAFCEADFSPGVVQKILRMARFLEPFATLKRLFEKSDIGWSKFATIAPVLTRDNASDFFWHLKNKTAKSTLEEMARALREEKEARQGSVKKSKVIVAANSAKEKPIVPPKEQQQSPLPMPVPPKEQQQSPLPMPVLGTQSAKGEQVADKDEPGCTCSCGCNHKKGVGEIFYVAGKAAVNVTLYADVAEALFQRADMLEKSRSKIADLSKVVEGLLYTNAGHLAHATHKKESYKRKREREVIVVTYDKEEKKYSSRSRCGDFEVSEDDVRMVSKNFSVPLELNELRERAIRRAKEYMLSRLSIGKELTDYIPKLIEDFVFFRSKGWFCEFPGCNCRGLAIHHLDRFAINRSCHPDRLVLLCLRHHKLAHDGAMGGEDGPICGLHIDVSLARRRAEKGAERDEVDSMYRHMREIAARNRHQPTLYC